MYAAGHLAEHPAGTWINGSLAQRAPRRVEVDVYDQLPTPWGLVRSGVAPDHPQKKDVARVFEEIATRGGVRLLGNVDVGRDVTTDELAHWYDAVIYAIGAQAGRQLDVPGAELEGSSTAHDIVAWYNGHPNYTRAKTILRGERAVIIGNGNVALDVARVLSLSPEDAARTDIAVHAEEALRASTIREVVIVGRRGPQHAAFTNPEMEELLSLDTVDIIVDSAEFPTAAAAATTAAEARRKRLLAELIARKPRGSSRRIRFMFGHKPSRIMGSDFVTSVELVSTTGHTTVLDTGLVVAAIGYAPIPLTGLPFDDVTEVIPNTAGRVQDCTGTYVTGWIKRGPSGVIGTNKWCARETVGALFDDANAGLIGGRQPRSHAEVLQTLTSRGVEPVQWHHWHAIDAHEKAQGRATRRPRLKLTSRSALLAVAHRS
ncbi:ferredoxin--NADP reductase domain-containing protein [Mycolicibacterium vinylchloridicum]|uniref:NADP oxidoreductase n=1 Tax=Mycolicibacterium vinylchloridicum TaxID=2736928 RepID=UPI0015CC94B5|nr:NADP oxidoreductase [Mycolicibacterium vinylchloridicum]